MTEIASIIKVFMEPGLKNSSPAQASLKPGALLTGRITEIFPNGLLQINFGEFRSRARVKFPVAKGDTLRFEVLETGDRIKLKVQEPPPDAARERPGRPFKLLDLNQFRQALEVVLQKPGDPFMDRESPVKIRLLLSRLSNQLLPLQPEKGTDQIVTLLKSNLANSGIFFEKRMKAALLRIFKTPARIDVGRAVSHPFITNIFSSDLKPTLLKLLSALDNTGASRNQSLISIRESSLDLLNHIHAQQEKLARCSPGGPGKHAFTYNRENRSPSGMYRVSGPTPASGTSREAILHEKAANPLLKAFQSSARKSRITLDHRVKATGEPLGKNGRGQASRTMPVLPEAGPFPENAKQRPATIKSAIDNRSTPDPGASFTVPGRQGKAVSSESRMPEIGRETLRAFSMPAQRKTVSLAEELDRLATNLAKLSSDSAGRPDGKKTAGAARSIRSLIRQHQLPSDGSVNRALTEMESKTLFSKTAPASSLKTGLFTDRMLQELALLREFVDQQKTELNHNLEIIRTLQGQTETSTDTGDRPGSEKERAADPVQVITFSLPMEEGKKAARLKVFYPLKKRTGGHLEFRISLLLSMERMGRIRTDIVTHERNLSIRFSTENEAARRHIGRHFNRLDALFNNHFETVTLSSAVDEKTISAFEYEDLEISDDRMVNLHV